MFFPLFSSVFQGFLYVSGFLVFAFWFSDVSLGVLGVSMVLSLFSWVFSVGFL